MQFYAATAGREAAELVALSLGIQTEANAVGRWPRPVETVAQLVPLNESSLPLVATVLTLTVSVSNEEPNLGPTEAGGATVAAFVPGAGIALGQGPAAASGRGGGGAGADEPAQEEEAGAPSAMAAPAISVWERIVLGWDEALERFRRKHPSGLSGAGSWRPAGDRPGSPASPRARRPGRALEPALGSRPAPEPWRRGPASRADPDGESRGDRRGHRVALGRGRTA